MRTTSTPGLNRVNSKKRTTATTTIIRCIKPALWIIVGIAIDDSLKAVSEFQCLKEKVSNVASEATVQIVEAAKEEVPTIRSTADITQEMWDRLSLTTGTNHEVRAERIRVDEDFDVFTDHDVSPAAINSVLRGVMKGKGQMIIDIGKKYGVNPVFLAGIAFQESGGGTSRIALKMNNVCGILVDGGPPRSFEAVDDCIEYTARQLRYSRYYYKAGKMTVGQIQPTYCPVGAKNDPKGLNKEWLGGVIKGMNLVFQADEKGALASN